MKNKFLYFFLLIFNFAFLCSQSIDDLGIKVSGKGRQFVFTNKEAGTFHGEVNDKNSGGWQGWFINAEKILHDFSISIKGKQLDRTRASTTVFPHQIIRTYPNHIKETVTLLDSIDVILIEINNPSAEITIQPTDNFVMDSAISSVNQDWKRTNAAAIFAPTEIVVARQLKRNVVTFAIAAGRDFQPVRETAYRSANLSNTFIQKRKERMQQLLDHSSTQTNNTELTKAIAWAKLQVDALIMNQSTGGERTKGIFAGLPWFNNYWGRDSFISLPGATYLTGNFNDARDILRSYANFQELNNKNSNYGRIPNLATPQSVIYNTADGTPWFVRSLYEFVKYSGDTSFVREMYPIIFRSIEGTIKFHSDSLGFLTHGDAESWMDAVGPNGPWSPRGNRACDVQVLWHQQLMVGVFFAEYFNEFKTAARWKSIADIVEKNFEQYFIDTKSQLVFDHLNSDGSSSSELRPNQLFTFDMIMPEAVRQNMVRTIIKELVYEHGTATLAQSDSNFHPFHEHPPYYVKDAAYHNGIIWTWLNGAAIYAATRYDLQDLVFPITKYSVRQMLNRGTVGALSELLDAHPRTDNTEPRLSGTYSQAWSSAEFIRSIYQDYFGISIDLPSATMRVQPKLPKEISTVTFEQRVGAGSVTIFYKNEKERTIVILTPKDLPKKFTIHYLWVYENGDAVNKTYELLPGKTLTIDHTASTLVATQGTTVVREDNDKPGIFLKNFSDRKYFTNISLAQPELKKKFPVLRGPTHPLLSHEQIRTNNRSSTLLFSKSDPVGDDAGIDGTYQYPINEQFKKGILDITNAVIRYDEKNLYCTLTFANLHDPGWHPEYGFQLTMAAVAINTGAGINKTAGINSNFNLDSLHYYDKMIVVGGGVRVLDQSGKILCEYIPKPEDIKNPIGNLKSKSIEFSVPLEYLGTPNTEWKMTILVGAQDDHGGAGIGEFRAIGKNVSEWLGGGKLQQNDSNVYDVIIMN
jgi:glycogen debranching enzyme